MGFAVEIQGREDYHLDDTFYVSIIGANIVLRNDLYLTLTHVFIRAYPELLLKGDAYKINSVQPDH